MSNCRGFFLRGVRERNERWLDHWYLEMNVQLWIQCNQLQEESIRDKFVALGVPMGLHLLHDWQRHRAVANRSDSSDDCGWKHGGNRVKRRDNDVCDLNVLNRRMKMKERWEDCSARLLFVPLAVGDVPETTAVFVNGIGRLLSFSLATWVIIDEKSASFDVLLIVTRKRIFWRRWKAKTEGLDWRTIGIRSCASRCSSTK